MNPPTTPNRFVPPPPPWYESTSSPRRDSPPLPPSVLGGIIVLLVISLAVGLLGFFLCGIRNGHRKNRVPAEAAVAAAAQPPRAQPSALPQLEPSRRFVELQLCPARAANPTPRPPAFKYDPSVKHNATGGGVEVATCSVCLGAFKHGESVRLLPVCLHLYHVECIDPWLDAHSTCPLCRSDTAPTMDAAQLPSV